VSAPSVKKPAPKKTAPAAGGNMLDQLRNANDTAKDHGGIRKNFVRMNTNNYKPAMRGAAYSNKIMAKKTNSLAQRARW